MINNIYLTSANEINEALNSNGVLLLNDFLNNSDAIVNEFESLDFEEVFEPDTRHYFKGKPKSFDEVLNYFKQISDFDFNSYELFKFKRGNYTLQHFDNQYEGFECYLFFTRNWSEDFRGELTYVFEEPLIFNIQNNSCVICLKPENINRFFKRVNYKAENNEFFALRFFKK
jgi:hypothetical protein